MSGVSDVAWDIDGHAGVLAALSRHLTEGRVAHAYLFCGPRNVGKATAALWFAMALNCEAAGDAPCGVCRPCRFIAEGKHPDVETVTLGGVCDESEHDHSRETNRDIRICQVRRLQRVATLAPFEGRIRVAIVDPADRMNEATANAFLKTLEEPPARLVVILVTDREEALLPTVRSRLRRVAFRAAPAGVIVEALERRMGLSHDRAVALARAARGRIGWALAAAADPSVEERRQEALDLVASLAAAPVGERFRYAERLARRFSEQRDDVYDALDAWETWWRDVLLVAAGREALVTNPSRLDTLRTQASQYRAEGALRVLSSLRRTRRLLEDHVQPQPALERLTLALTAA
jgi:DNA polymerase-3 subunit delta'